MSRLIVQVVLRDSMSISPDCSAGEALLGAERRELHLGCVAEDGGRDGAAEIDVDARPVALVVRRREAGQTGVDAALDEALRLDVVERGRATRPKRQEPKTAAPMRPTEASFSFFPTFFCCLMLSVGRRSPIAYDQSPRFSHPPGASGSITVANASMVKCRGK